MDTERIHVLVVDDVADMATSTAELLGLWGYDAAACIDGGAALACARNRRPAAVLLDLAMPRMDGFQFATLFRAIPGCESVPIVAVSGYSSPASRTRAREVGIAHYLMKPADLGQLKVLLALLTRRTEVSSRPRIRSPREHLRHRSRRPVARHVATAARDPASPVATD